MQAESGVNAVGTPVGAPTCPPCVASSAGLAHVPGAQEPGLLGSQPESPGPQASTVPPPVTRQPAGTPSGCWAGAAGRSSPERRSIAECPPVPSGEARSPGAPSAVTATVIIAVASISLSIVHLTADLRPPFKASPRAIGAAPQVCG